VFLASDSGDEAYLRMIQSHCPAKQRLELKVGAQVRHPIPLQFALCITVQ
jgi:hypothetical protein